MILMDMTEGIYNKDQHIAQLESINQALTNELVALKKRMMARNNEQSLKWRNKYFYLKKQMGKIEKELSNGHIY